MRGGRLRRKSAMYGRGDGTLTYREYIGDIIPMGSLGSLWRFAVAGAHLNTPSDVTIRGLGRSSESSSCPGTADHSGRSICRLRD